MLYFRLTQNGYDAYDCCHEKLYSEENCRFLFSFVESNTTKIKELLSTYFDTIIDVESLTITGKKPSKRLMDDIKKEMKRLHPFLASDEYITVFRMLTEHLNRQLVLYNTPLMPIEVFDDLYYQVIQPLLITMKPFNPPFLNPTNDKFRDHYYKQLQIMYKNPVHVAGLDYIEEVRNEVERYIYWVLDRSCFRFKSYDRDTRVRLYSRIFREGFIRPDIHAEYACYWVEPEGYDYYEHTTAGQLIKAIVQNDPPAGQTPEEIANQALSNVSKTREKDLQCKETAVMLKKVTNDHDEFTQAMKDFMNDQTDAAGDDTTPTMLEEYRVETFDQLIQIQLWFLTKADLLIKRCRYCDRLFIADRLSSDYCNRIKNGEKEPCDVVGPKKSFARLMEDDHALKIYNRVYKTMYARKKRGSLSDADFKVWKTEARSLLDKTRAGEMKESDFEAWLTQNIRAWG